MDSVMILHKDKQLFELMYSLAPKSILFQEGAGWKQRRRAVSSLFSFDYVVAQVPQICLVCDRLLDRFEAQA